MLTASNEGQAMKDSRQRCKVSWYKVLYVHHPVTKLHSLVPSEHAASTLRAAGTGQKVVWVTFVMEIDMMKLSPGHTLAWNCRRP